MTDAPTRFHVEHDPVDGGYVAQAVDRPGAIGQGATEAEAIEDATLAVAVLRAYEAEGGANHD